MGEYNNQTDYNNYYNNNYSNYNYNYTYSPTTRAPVAHNSQTSNLTAEYSHFPNYYLRHSPNANYYNTLNQTYNMPNYPNHNFPNQSYYNVNQNGSPRIHPIHQYYSEQNLNAYYYNSSVPNGQYYYEKQPRQQRQYVYNNSHNYIPPLVPQHQQVPENSEFDAQEEFAEKLISYARFNRNNELMKTIVSETVVPDVRSFVTSSRLKNLSNQVHALKTHQKKVAKEIEDIDQDFKSKKQDLHDKAKHFQEEYKKLCEPVVTSEDYEDMVNKSYETLKRNMELLNWQRTLAWAHETAAASGTVTTAKSDPLLAEILAASPLQ